MQRIIILLAAAMAYAAATAARAQPAAEAPQQTFALPSTYSTIHSPFRLALGEVREFQGQYFLNNGKTLTVSRRGQRLFADVVGDDDVELVAVSPGAFVTRDGKTLVKFQQAANGIVEGVQIRH